MALEIAAPLGAVEVGSDEAYVRDALRGDADAFAQIVGLYQGRVFQFLYQLTRHRQDAEDLTQATFIKAFRHLSRFEAGRPLINWLLTIARNNALNHFRTVRPYDPVPEHLPADGLSPAGAAEEREQSGNLWERVRAVLPARQFEVLWLRYGEELSVKETARVVGLTQTHVKILVFRARQTLMKGNLHL